MRDFHIFWRSNKFKLALVGAFFLLLYVVYKWFFGRDIKMPNPTFAALSNLESIECLPLARGGSSVWNSFEQHYTGAWARDNRTKLDKKWVTKWISVRNGKIYLGTYTGSADSNHYINFDEVFDLVIQKNETKILGSRMTVGSNSSQNVRFTTLMIDKTKGILSISVNESSWFGDESVGGFNAVYTCKEIPPSTLSGSK